MKLIKLKKYLAGLMLMLFLYVSCSTLSDKPADTTDVTVPKYVPHVKIDNSYSWRHTEKLPAIRPIIALFRGILNDNWDRFQSQYNLKQIDMLVRFSSVFIASNLKDIVLWPLESLQESIALSGSKEEILTEMTKQIKQNNLNTGFLMRIDHYEPGLIYSPTGVDYNPEIKLTLWFITDKGETIWTGQTAVRTIKPLPPDVSIDHEKSVNLLMRKTAQAMTDEFRKFWTSPEVVAKMQTAEIINFSMPAEKIPKFDETESGFTSSISQPITPKIPDTPKDAGFRDSSE